MNALHTLAAAALLACTGAASAQTTSTEALDRMAQDEAASQQIYRVHFPDAAMARKAAISFEGALLEAHYDAGYLVMDLSPHERAKLAAFGLRIEPDTAFMARRDAMLATLRRVGMPSLLGRAAAESGADESIPKFPCYETVEETFAAAQGFTQTYPQLAEWIDAGDSWQKANGGSGWDMMVLKLTNKRTTGVGGEAKPKLLITAAIHAREYTTAPVALAFARQLLEGYGKDADATWLLDHHEVHLLLQNNPDGRKIAERGLMKRKNDDTQFCDKSPIARGVDLNRNYAFNWNASGGKGSSAKACNDGFRGPSAGSEPEVQAVQNYAKQIWTDRRGPLSTDAAPADTSGIHIDLHSSGGLILWPWGWTKAPAPNGTALQTLGRKMAFFNGYTPQQSIGLYPSDGTSDGPSYGELGVAAIAMELGTQFFESCASYESTVKPKVIDTLLYAAKVARTPYLTPAGPDVVNLALAGDAATGGVSQGSKVKLTAQASDTRYGSKGGAEPTQAIAAAEVYIDTPPWVPGAKAVVLKAKDGAFNASTERLAGTIATKQLSVGTHMVYVRAKDAAGNWGAPTASFLIVK